MAGGGAAPAVAEGGAGGELTLLLSSLCIDLFVWYVICNFRLYSSGCSICFKDLEVY